MTKKNKRRGFTVVELVIVIAVIAILAAVLIPTYVNLVKKANEAKAQAEAKNLITEMLADILLGKEGDADLLVFSEKGSDVYAYAYSRTEGKIIAYKNNPTAKTGSFENTVQSILTAMGDAITDRNVAEDDWRHPNKIKAVVNELNTKGTMIVYANYTINADKFAVHVHSFGAWENAGETVGHRHTCSCGATETEAHKWDNGVVTNEATEGKSGTKTYTCTICNATKTETIAPAGHTHSVKTNHAAVPASCITDGSIEYWECECGAKFSDKELTKQISDPTVKALGHDWGNWSAGESSTCEAGGTQVRTCKRCPAQDTRTTPPAGHKIVTIPAVAATCITEGKTEGTKCSVCGKTITEPTTVPATGHSWGEWTSDNDENHTRKCTKCQETETKAHNIDANGECTVCKRKINTSSAIIVNNVEALVSWAGKTLEKDTVVKLGADMTLSTETVFNVENKHVFNLDLNGKTLTIDGANRFIVEGAVTISDTSAGKTGKIIAKEGSNFAGGLITVRKTNEKAIVGTSNNLCTVENVTIDATANKNINACAIEMYNSGAVKVNNGAVIRANGYAISGKADDNAFEQGKLIIDGGHIESTGSYAIYHPQKINEGKGAQFVINGGTIKGKTGAIYLANNKNKVEKKLEINGGELISDGEWIIYVDSTELRKTTNDNWTIRIFVNGGNFKASNGNAHFARLEMKEANRLATGKYMKGSSCVVVYLKGGTYTNITNISSRKCISYLDMAPEKTEGEKSPNNTFTPQDNKDGTWSVVTK